MSELIITIDIDWACEAAIEKTLGFFYDLNIKPTVFSTHNSRILETQMSNIEVGLHPYFGHDSSHGTTIKEVVNYVITLPHNIPAFRCHRFAHCNLSNQAMLEAGMLLSSNVCTDLEIVPAFHNRFGLLEVPIFMEDGGYLWRQHPLYLTDKTEQLIKNDGRKVLLIHPMHFAINTPNFNYMYDIKQSVSRFQWNNLTHNKLKQLSWTGRGIRDVVQDIIKLGTDFATLGDILTSHQNSVITV